MFPIRKFLQRKKKNTKYIKIWVLGGGGEGAVTYLWNQAFREVVLEPNPQEKLGMSVFSCTEK